MENQPILTNATRADVTLRHNLYHVENEGHKYSGGKGALALDGQTERVYTTETRRTPFRKVFWPKRNSGKERHSWLLTCFHRFFHVRIQSDSGGICNTLGNDSMCDSTQKSTYTHGSHFERLPRYGKKEDTDHPASTNSNYVINNITTNITCIVIRSVNHHVLLMRKTVS